MKTVVKAIVGAMTPCFLCALALAAGCGKAESEARVYIIDRPAANNQFMKFQPDTAQMADTAAFGAGGSSSGHFIDIRDGQRYRTVEIGGMVWMAENLSYETGASWCNKNDRFYCGTYGRLYDWNTAVRACPAEWRLPSQSEWDDLVQAAGGKSVAGKKLKSKTGWNNRKDGTDGGGMDDYAFSALPGGFRYAGGSYDRVGYSGLWWSATDNRGVGAYLQNVYYESDSLVAEYVNKGVGLSVRCIKK